MTAEPSIITWRVLALVSDEAGAIPYAPRISFMGESRRLSPFLFLHHLPFCLPFFSLSLSIAHASAFCSPLSFPYVEGLPHHLCIYLQERVRTKAGL